MKSSIEPGTLYVVATPIGNLEDISSRALETLRRVDFILAEDTRHFGVLKKNLQIETKTVSCHEHNERTRAAEAVEKLLKGKSASLVSDAGTPTICDPGYHILNACYSAGIPVRSVPGPSAVTAALSVSGFNSQSFHFNGFLPNKSGKRESTLQQALGLDSVSIFYESPHRIVKTLSALAALEPKRQICVCRELTKKYEETTRGEVSEVLHHYLEKEKIKGEVVLIIDRPRRVKSDRRS